MVEATATQAQASTDMAAAAALGVISAAVGRKGSAVLGRRRQFPLHLWLMVIGEPGDGKSEVFRNLGAPLRAIQSLPDDVDVAPEQRPARSVYERLRDRDPYSDDASPALPPTRLAEAVDALRRTMTAAGAQTSSLLLPDDITPTPLIEALGANATGCALVSAEGGFETWLMQGGGVANQSAASLNKAWDGEGFTRRRQQRRSGRTNDDIHIVRPALTMLVGVQPDIFDSFSRHGTLRGRGFTLRFLYTRSTLVHAEFPDDPTETEIPESVRAAFEAEVYRLVCLPGWPPDRPVTIPISTGAARLNAAFARQIESRTRTGDLGHAGPFARRLRSNLPRIAGLLHLAWNAPTHGRDVVELPIDENRMAGAVEIATYFLGEGLAVMFQGSNAPPGVSLIDGVERLLLRTPNWVGAPDELVAALERVVPQAKRECWPKGTNNITRFLRAHLADLTARGITLSEDRKSLARMIMLTRRERPPEG
jgi:hypothetical protein